MGEFLSRLITEADLGRPHIVAPDVGTPAALFAAATHPNRSPSVIVGAGGTAVPLQLGEPLASWVLDPDLDNTGASTRTRWSTPRSTTTPRCTRRDPRRLPGLLRRRPLRRVDALCAAVPRRASRACRGAAEDHHPRHRHRRPERPCRPSRQRRVPPPADPQQPPRHPRLRSLRLGRELRSAYAGVIVDAAAAASKAQRSERGSARPSATAVWSAR